MLNLSLFIGHVLGAFLGILVMYGALSTFAWKKKSSPSRHYYRVLVTLPVTFAISWSVAERSANPFIVEFLPFLAATVCLLFICWLWSALKTKRG